MRGSLRRLQGNRKLAQEQVSKLVMLTVREGVFRPGPRVASALADLGIIGSVPEPAAFISTCRRLALLDALDAARLAGAF